MAARTDNNQGANTVLHLAILHKKITISRYLLSEDFMQQHSPAIMRDFITQKNNPDKLMPEQKTALELAHAQGDHEIVRLLEQTLTELNEQIAAGALRASRAAEPQPGPARAKIAAPKPKVITSTRPYFNSLSMSLCLRLFRILFRRFRALSY